MGKIGRKIPNKTLSFNTKSGKFTASNRSDVGGQRGSNMALNH